MDQREKTEEALERAIREDPKNENARRTLDALRRQEPGP
jgi:hypothetical protein